MTERDDTSMEDLAAAYALGALSPEETRAFEAFMASSAETQREVAEYREVGALLAAGAPAVAPDPRLKERVLASISREKVRTFVPPVPAPAPRMPLPFWMALAASVMLAVGFGLKYSNAKNALSYQIARADSSRAALDSVVARLAAREKTLDEILEPDMQLSLLTATGNPDPKVQLFWNPKKNLAIVHAFRLAQAPAGRVYQLWFIKDGKPVPSVTFNSEPTGHALVQNITVPGGTGITNAALTIEPEGGSPQPTSPVMMIGSMGA
jgi:anti-sigma-K factor RskA